MGRRRRKKPGEAAQNKQTPKTGAQAPTREQENPNW